MYDKCKHWEKAFPYLGKYFRRKRKIADLRQIDVANKLKLNSSQFISNVERGKCTYSLQHLQTIISLYQIDPEEILKILLQARKYYYLCSINGHSNSETLQALDELDRLANNKVEKE